MKKLFALITVFGMLSLGFAHSTFAQEDASDANANEETTETKNDTTETAKEETAPAPEENTEDAAGTGEAAAEEGEGGENAGLHQEIKKNFIDGGPAFMGVVLLALIFGLAFAIERIIYLNLATTNNKKLVKKVEEALETGGVEEAKNVCRETRGPTASVFYQGLDRFDEGLEVVEKAVVSYGSVQMGLLERGLTWISLFISIAPMLGFMGTVIGMIQAFDQIAEMGDISAGAVAAPIKVALITTVSGLIVAIILQLFYNYLVSKIDAIVNSMEDASVSLIDMLVKYKEKA
jgi:biopolymer transport protein ExbB